MKNFSAVIVLIFLFAGGIVKGQNFLIDISFTLHSDYKKQVKYYPDIKPVWPIIDDRVVQKKNLVYVSYGKRDMHLDLYSLKKVKDQNCR